MNLTFEERNSSLANKLKEHLATRLDLHRAKNDAPLSPEATALLRGRIAECKAIMAVFSEEMTIPDAD